MDSIEKAIRNALAKGDPGDRAFREKIYRSAFGALDRAISSNPNMTEAIATRRRQALLEAVTAIETEFVPAKPAPATQQDASQHSAPPVVTPPSGTIAEPAVPAQQRLEPTLDGERPRQAPGKHNARSAPTPERKRPQKRRFSAVLLSVLALAIIISALAIWGLPTPATGPDTPPRQAGGEAPPRLSDDAAALESWIDIFTPADPTSVSAPGDTRAEVMEDDEGQFLRISSGASGSPVLFDIGQGVLEEVAGGRAIFTIAARGADGQRTQISVDCSLADLGDCGRKRYDVGATREEFLFEIELPTARPDSGGTITINPDLEGDGKALDIYAIRVLPRQ